MATNREVIDSNPTGRATLEPACRKGLRVFSCPPMRGHPGQMVPDVSPDIRQTCCRVLLSWTVHLTGESSMGLLPTGV